jgi:ABC-type lipoprotein export system ATPase subunit
LARAILTIETDESFVLALHGTWGSGKSTVLNFVEFYLKHPRLLEAALPAILYKLSDRPRQAEGVRQHP